MTDYLQKPFERFTSHESSSSILLLGSALLALILANTNFSGLYHAFLNYPISIGAGDYLLSKPLVLWINDALMAVFFFIIGLEIKREILAGELSSRRKAALPVIAAIGGILVPVSVFMILNRDPETAAGWAIPMATDIAFALGILRLLGNRVPTGLKVFLVAFAIVDDLLAVLTIAAFYSQGIKWDLVAIAAAVFLVLLLMNRFKIYSTYLFLGLGVLIWVLLLKSGIHATIAGVLMAFTIPMRREIRIKDYREVLSEALNAFNEGSKEKSLLTHVQLGAIDEITAVSRRIVSPLQFLENKLHGWVAFFIMPLFAFANAGVSVSEFDLSLWNLSVSIGSGLVFGKFIGISLFTWIAVKLGWAGLPEGIKFKQILGVAFLGGIGFTMSLFLTSLAFSSPAHVDAAKAGIIVGSIISGIIGYFILRRTL